jgi:hypothetical protein
MTSLIYPSWSLLFFSNEIIENVGILDIYKAITSVLCKK